MEIYRPPQKFLSHFWTLTEGDDEKRVEASIQLIKMIQAVEEKDEREQMTTYSINRLVRGLGSGRKFARVGFSTALTLLLRLQKDLKTSQVLQCFTEKLKFKGKALSKAERGAFYLGHAFALSAIIQSGRLSEVNGGILNEIVRDILFLADKRSFLKPVCCKAMECLIAEVSENSFVEHVWPLIRVELSRGWEECTLDRLSLLLMCIEKFPDVVNKKFTKSHWGPSILSEANDDKLLQSLKNSTEKSNTLREKILPFMLRNGRNALSIWKGLGEKMFLPGKDNVISHQQLIALEILSNIISLSSNSDEVLSLIFDPSVSKAIFFENRTQNQALIKVFNVLVSNICERLKAEEGNLLRFVKAVFKLEKDSAVGDQDGKLAFIHGSYFAKIVSKMDKTEMEQYVNILIAYVKGNDNNTFFSESVKKREKQLDWCFRQLQHACCSQLHTSPEVQQLVLSLFLRNGFFNGVKKNDTVLHCDFLDRFVETSSVKKLCESFLFKSLDQLSTMKTDKATKNNHFAEYTNLLSYLVHYFQSLLSCQDVQLTSAWTEKNQSIWHQLWKRIKGIENKTTMNDHDSAFRLLYFYMAFYLLTDINSATDLLKDIFICHDKSSVKTKKEENEDDPYWVEVLTEILLQLLSFQSHLARMISSMVFKLIVPYLNAESVALVTQVLLQDKTQHSVVFEEDEDDEGDDLLHDVPSEKSSDEEDDDGEDNGNDEESGGHDKEIDEAFRSSLKDALGNAAFDDNDQEHEDLSDMSDSEMFKLDEALAEVFRQRTRKTGQKKAKEEKRKEIGNFRLRVLDLLDILIKSNRCEDFCLDLLKSLMAQMFTSSRVEEQAAYDRAKSSFHQLKTRCKGITDSFYSEKEQIDFFEELMDLAQRVTDSSQLQQIAQACCFVIKVSCANCMQILQDKLSKNIIRKKSKPLPSFFMALVDIDPVVFQPLSSLLIDCLKNKAAKQQYKAMVCSLLNSLAKTRGNNVPEGVSESANIWMKQAASATCECVQALEKDSARGLFVRELLLLTLTLLGRTDVLSKSDFGSGVQKKLLDIKSRMGTDTRKSANKIIAAFERMKGKKEKTEASDIQKTGKKRKAEETESPNTKSKKKKI